MKGHIFFDLDGVILDSMGYHVKAWLESLAHFGLSFREEEIYLHEGAIELDTAKQLFTSRGIEPTDEFFHQAFKLQKKIFMEKYAKLVRPYPEVPELLSELRRAKKTLALVTSSHREILDMVLPRSIEKFFTVVITGDQVPRRKPHPDPYLKALESLKAKQNEALVVENAPAGILSAKSARIFCVAITTTLSQEHLNLADLIVNSHRELINILGNSARE